MLRHVEQSPTVFHLNDCQVPALKSLIARSRRRYGAVPPPLAAWLASVRWRLELATRAEPTPPVDWTRPAEFKCNCRHCGQLRAFLVDPTNAVGRIAAAESSRGHLIDTIEQNRCDVKHALERKGSPYSLVLTKTNQTFNRAQAISSGLQAPELAAGRSVIGQQRIDRRSVPVISVTARANAVRMRGFPRPGGRRG